MSTLSLLYLCSLTIFCPPKVSAAISVNLYLPDIFILHHYFHVNVVHRCSIIVKNTQWRKHWMLYLKLTWGWVVKLRIFVACLDCLDPYAIIGECCISQSPFPNSLDFTIHHHWHTCKFIFISKKIVNQLVEIYQSLLVKLLSYLQLKILAHAIFDNYSNITGTGSQWSVILALPAIIGNIVWLFYARNAHQWSNWCTCKN